jgi:hypothetical protein
MTSLRGFLQLGTQPMRVLRRLDPVRLPVHGDVNRCQWQASNPLAIRPEVITDGTLALDAVVATRCPHAVLPRGHLLYANLIERVLCDMTTYDAKLS